MDLANLNTIDFTAIGATDLKPFDVSNTLITLLSG